MEINKQLFEDVLLGKLKGTFVLRNGETYYSDLLCRNYGGLKFTHPYVVGFKSYTPKGIFDMHDRGAFDIVNFTPNTDMKENELKITIPKNHEIDWQESAKQEKIVFKNKENAKPRSWEEYCKQQIANKKPGYYIDDADCSSVVDVWDDCVRADRWRNVLPSKELTEAFLAMMQLMSLRQAWIGDWKPDWSCGYSSNYCVVGADNRFDVIVLSKCRYALSFPTIEMAKDFMDCFIDLLEIAKPLL